LLSWGERRGKAAEFNIPTRVGEEGNRCSSHARENITERKYAYNSIFPREEEKEYACTLLTESRVYFHQTGGEGEKEEGRNFYPASIVRGERVRLRPEKERQGIAELVDRVCSQRGTGGAGFRITKEGGAALPQRHPLKKRADMIQLAFFSKILTTPGRRKSLSRKGGVGSLPLHHLLRKK